MPSNPADLPTPEPEGTESKKSFGIRQILSYLLILLLVSSLIAVLWYAQTQGMLTGFGF